MDMTVTTTRSQWFPKKLPMEFARRQPLGVVGAAMVLLVVALGISAPFAAPFDPQEFHASDPFESPNSTYWLGTDDKGRDMLSRIMYGAQISIEVGAIAVVLGTGMGTIVGLTSGYFGGKFDLFAQRVVDSFQAFPALLLGLAVTAALGRSVLNVGIALALVTWPTASRVMRSSVLGQRGMVYVDAARVIGASTPRIIFRHILPNVVSVFIVMATAALAQAILIEASLSFLGAGVQPPAPSWGSLLLDAQRFMVRAPWMAIFPGLAVSTAVFGFSIFGDALRDHWDPRLRNR